MNKQELKEYQKVISYDLHCLELKEGIKDNDYHLRLLKSNLKDLFNKLTKEVKQ